MVSSLFRDIDGDALSWQGLYVSVKLKGIVIRGRHTARTRHSGVQYVQLSDKSKCAHHIDMMSLGSRRCRRALAILFILSLLQWSFWKWPHHGTWATNPLTFGHCVSLLIPIESQPAAGKFKTRYTKHGRHIEGQLLNLCGPAVVNGIRHLTTSHALAVATKRM